MAQELVVVACVVLGVILIPSLINVRPSYYPIEPDPSGGSPALDGQPAE